MANKMVQESHYVTRTVNTSKAISTNWFDTDIAPTTGLRQEEIEKHTLMLHCSLATKVNVIYKIDGQTITMVLNDDTALAANAVYIFDILIPQDATGYNIQHDTGTINVTAIIAKSKTAMVG